MDYLVLAQHAQRPAPEMRYPDVEGSLYNYPRRYFALIDGYEPFLYYRPTNGASREERSTYVGYGRLLDWFADMHDPNRRFVRVAGYRPFPRPVPFAETNGAFYETGFNSRNQFQGRSVRRIGSVDYYRILAAAGMSGDPLQRLDNVDALVAPSRLMLDRLPREAPTYPLLEITSIPPGAGYVPSGRQVDLYESAALQERARADHQRVLQTLQSNGERRGAVSLYNNNDDLLLRREDRSILIEAKSLLDERATVDRMRYGMGQLLDYGVRYRAELQGADPLLAFGRIPSQDAGWIAQILDENGIGFAGLHRDDVVPLNERARAMFVFT